MAALIAGPGSALGELVAYVAGRESRAIAGDWRTGLVTRLEGWLRRHGFWALLVLATIPNFLFDLVGLAAGSLRYPVRKFLLACLLGNTLKYLFFAYAGGSVIDRILG